MRVQIHCLSSSMDPQANSEGIRIANRLKELVKALKGSSRYDGLRTLLRIELERSSSIQLCFNHDHWEERELFAQAVTALVEELEEADVSRLEKLNVSLCWTEHLVLLSTVLEMGRFPSLTHLDLDWSVLAIFTIASFAIASEAIAAALASGHSSGLLHLSLRFPSVVPTIARAIRLGRISKLQHLYLCGDGVSGVPAESEEFIKVIETGMLSDVVHLSLVNCSLGADVIEVLAQAMKSNVAGRLKHLDLSGNPIGERGSDAIARLLTSGSLSSLEFLNLHRFGMGDGGTAAIFRAIGEAPPSKIRELNIGGNKVGDEGMKELLNALRSRHLSELQTLELDDSYIAQEGMLALAEFLQDGRYVGALETIILSQWEPVSHTSAGALVSAYANNDSLTVRLYIGWPDGPFKTNYEKYRKRNIALSAARDRLKEEKDVPATTAKVFVCGFEKVGKTTLRTSLQKTKLGALFSPRTETKHRTTGIEVSNLVKRRWKGQRKVVLAIWDLAGQPEYRVLQSGFCLAEGKATIFLIVCNAVYQEKDLLYWLKFVASSCEQGVQRHVLVALNCFDGQKCSAEPLWRKFIQKQRDTFKDLLHIHEHPFVLDARYSNSVAELKKHLFTLSQSLLDNHHIPGICKYIPKYLRSWQTNHEFPVLSLQELLPKLLKNFNMRTERDNERLLAALDFLHAAGNVVLFSEEMLRLYDSDVSITGLLVLDPNWFCQRVVGELLLPSSFLEGQSSRRSIAEPDGSISLDNLNAFLEGAVGIPQQVKSVVAMLMSLGLCYHAGPDKVLVPALTQRDDTRTWEECGIKDETAGQWVMGRSLTLLDQERTALPAALFHRLQVALAQDTKFGLDSSYTASKSSSIFKHGRMIALIQFDVNENDPEDDRLDILVKPLGFISDDDEANIRKRQLDLIEDIMDKLEPISTYCCPGVQFNRNVIIPWNAAKPTLSMEYRELVLVEKVKERVQQHGLGMHSNWCVDGYIVCYDDLLSVKDMEGLKRSMSGKCKRLEEDALFLGIDIDGIDEAQDGILEGSAEDPPPGLVGSEGSHSIHEIRSEDRNNVDMAVAELKGHFDKGVAELKGHVDKGVAELKGHMDKRLGELQRSIQIYFNKQNLILRKVQAFQSFSVAEKESSCPRFLYLTKSSDSGVWITLKKAFVSTFRIHFLCEARVEDGYMHQVQGQEGVEINNPKKWVRKLQPWLEWSLAIAIIVARVVGGVALPGLDPFLPNMSSSEGSSMALLEEFTSTLGDPALRSRVGTISDLSSSAQNQIELKQHAMMAAVVKDLIEETGRVEFWQKIGLRKAVLKYKDGTPAKCAWICDACYHGYSNRGALVADISP